MALERDSLLIKNTSKEQREEYIKNTYHCISDCDNCGLCKIFHGKQPEIIFADYIEGLREFIDIANEYKKIVT